MFCSNCGENVAGYSFCPKCGTPAEAAPAQPPVAPVVPPPPVYAPPPQPAYPPPPAAYPTAPPPQQAPYTPPPGQPYPPPQQPYPPQQQPYAPPQQQYAPYAPPVKAPVVHYAPGSYVEALHNHAVTLMFLIGIILFSAGQLFSIFANFGLGSLFSLIILAIPVTGFWLIFASAKMPKLPEKTLVSLTLFKVSAIISLVVSCITGLVFLIFSIVMFAATGGFSYIGISAGILGLFGFILLVASGATVVIAILYFKSIIQILAGIKAGIEHNHFAPLPKIKFFTLLTYITVGLSVLGTIGSIIINYALSSAFDMILYSLPSFLRETVADSLGLGSGVSVSAFFTLAGLAGVIICVIVLNAFNTHITGRSAPQNQTQ